MNPKPTPRHARPRRTEGLFRKAAALLAVTGAVLFGALSPAVAVNADSARAAAVVQPSANTVVSSTIKDGQVYGWDMADNTIPWAKLGSQLRGEIRAAQGSINGHVRIEPESIYPAQLSDDARKQLTYLAALSEPKTIANIGGPINTQGTKLDVSLQLPYGAYLVTVSGQINRTTTAADAGKQTQPQLSLWLDKNRDGAFTWQTEGSISPNGTIPDLKDRSVTVSGQTKVVVTQSTPLTVGLIAHGYNNDASGSGSGELSVGNAVISAIPILDK